MAIPSRIDYHYRIEREAGRGAFGIVYEACDEWRSDQRVAIKLLHSSTKGLTSLREFSLLHSFNFPTIARLLSVGRDPMLNKTYLVSEWAGGEDADSFPWHDHPDRLTLFASEMLRTLVYLHSHGLVHHDIKPSNCKVEWNGFELKVHLLDFGLAGRSGTRSRLRGTWDYLPPERWREKFVLPSIDLYATGVMLYRLATGHVPFHDLPAVQAVRKRAEHPVPDPRTDAPWLPNALYELILQLTDPNPANRTNSAMQALEFIQSAMPDSILPVDQTLVHSLNHLMPNSAFTRQVFALIAGAEGMPVPIEVDAAPYTDSSEQLAGLVAEFCSTSIPSALVDSHALQTQSENIAEWVCAHSSRRSPVLALSDPLRSMNVFGKFPTATVLAIFSSEQHSFQIGGARVAIPARSRVEAERLAREWLPHLSTPDGWFDWLYSASAGYDELVRRRIIECFRNGWLTLTPEGWSVQRADFPDDPPDDLSALYRDWMLQIPPRTLSLIGPMALFPHGIPIEEFAALTGIASESLYPLLWEGIVPRLLHFDNGGTVRFAPPIVRKMVADGVSESDRERLYRRLKSSNSSIGTRWKRSAMIHFAAIHDDTELLIPELAAWESVEKNELLAVDTFDVLLKLIQQPECPPRLRGLVSIMQGNRLSNSGKTGEALALMSRLLTDPELPQYEQLAAINLFASLTMHTGKPADAEQPLRTVLERTNSEHRDLRVPALVLLAWICIQQQRWQDAEVFAQETIELCRRSEVSSERMRAYNVLALVDYHVRGDLDAASQRWKVSLRLSRELGVRKNECDTLNNLGVAAATSGNSATAIRHWNQAVRIGRETGYFARLSAILINTGIKYFESGKLPQAELNFLQALDTLQRGERVVDQIYCLINLTELQLSKAAYLSAEHYNEQARRLLEDSGTPDQASIVWEYFADTRCRIGDAEGTLAALEIATQSNQDPSDFDRLRIKILRNAALTKTGDQIPQQELYDEIEQAALETTEETYLRMWLLRSAQEVTREAAVAFTEAAEDAQHRVYQSWAEYFGLLTNPDATPGAWENLHRRVNAFPELGWRTMWRLGQQQLSADPAAARTAFRRAAILLKQIARQLRQSDAAHYFTQMDQVAFRRNLTSQ